MRQSRFVIATLSDTRASSKAQVGRSLPPEVLALLPALAIVAVFFIGFVLWTGYLSLTRSGILPSYHYAGFVQYVRLALDERFRTAYWNLLKFGPLIVGMSLALGFALAALLDQKIAGERVYRTIFLYPLAMSFIVTGVAWQWMLSPSAGLSAAAPAGHFAIDWLSNPAHSMYAIVVATVWQSSGFAMAVFLASLRGVDPDLWRAARIDGIPTWRTYVEIILPTMRGVVITVLVVLAVGVVNAFDVVIALTHGGPGYSSDMPAKYMYDHAFGRSELAVGAASAIVMIATVAVLLLPYLIYRSRRSRTHV